MANLTTQLIVELLDKVSAPARGVARSLAGYHDAASTTPMADRSASVIGSMRLSPATTVRFADARAGLVDAVAGFYTLKAAIARAGRRGDEIRKRDGGCEEGRRLSDAASLQGFPGGVRWHCRATFRLSVNGLAEIAAAAGQAGIAGADLVRFTEAAAKIGVAFDISCSRCRVCHGQDDDGPWSHDRRDGPALGCHESSFECASIFCRRDPRRRPPRWRASKDVRLHRRTDGGLCLGHDLRLVPRARSQQPRSGTWVSRSRTARLPQKASARRSRRSVSTRSLLQSACRKMPWAPPSMCYNGFRNCRRNSRPQLPASSSATRRAPSARCSPISIWCARR